MLGTTCRATRPVDSHEAASAPPPGSGFRRLRASTGDMGCSDHDPSGVNPPRRAVAEAGVLCPNRGAPPLEGREPAERSPDRSPDSCTGQCQPRGSRMFAVCSELARLREADGRHAVRQVVRPRRAWRAAQRVKSMSEATGGLVPRPVVAARHSSERRDPAVEGALDPEGRNVVRCVLEGSGHRRQSQKERRRGQEGRPGRGDHGTDPQKMRSAQRLRHPHR